MTDNPQDPRTAEPEAGAGQVAGAPRRGVRARGWVVAAVGVVALVAGAGGGWAAARHATIGTGGAATSGGQRAGDQRPAVPQPASMIAFGSEHVAFRGSGLPDGAGSAKVRGLDATAALTGEGVARAARALGLSGSPVASWGAWVVGSTDGTGPSLSVSGDATASASYGDPALTCVPQAPGGPAPAPPGPVVPGPAPTATVPVPIVPTAPVGPPATIEPQPAAVPRSAEGMATAPPVPGSTGCSGTALDAAAATDRARALLTAMGADLGAPATSVSQDGALSTVDLRQVLDGHESGLAWTVTFVGAKVQALWGPLARVVDLGDYPVVSAADAVARLSDPRFTGSPAVPMAAPADGTGGVATSDASGPGSTGSDGVDPGQDATPTPVPVPSRGARLAWAVRQITLVRADLVVVPTALGDGSTVLLPTYRFTDTDGGTWQAPAVAQTALDLTAG